MRMDYVVHSVVIEPVVVTAQFNGSDVQATVDGLVVEMVATGSHAEHGHTFRFLPVGGADMDAHRALFAVGNKVRADFSLIEAAQSATVEQAPQLEQAAPTEQTATAA